MLKRTGELQRRAPLRRRTPLCSRSTLARAPFKTTPPRPAPKEKEKRPAPLVVTVRPPLVRGTYQGTTSAPRPKPVRVSKPRLLKLAREEGCLLRVPFICNRDPSTTVACHSNWQEHGKAGARKADDAYSVWGCSSCHAWLDQGSAPAPEKRAVFDGAMLRQVAAWERICADRLRSDADRKLAQWALEQLRRPVRREEGT